MEVKKIPFRKRIGRYIFIKLMCEFNKQPRRFRYWFSKIYSKPIIDKTAGIAGLPIFLYGVSIGKYSFLNGDAYLENVDIGNYCSIGRDFNTISGNHDMNYFSTFPFWARNIRTPFTGYDPVNIDIERPPKKTIIGNDVWIGSYVKIINGITVGDGAVIGTGSIVTKDVPPYAIVAGCPAKIIRYRFDEETVQKLLATKWWNYSREELLENWDKLEKIV